MNANGESKMFGKTTVPPATVIELATKTTKAMERNTSGLRGMLFDELESFLSGKTTPERVRTVAILSNSIIDSARLELEFARYVKTKGRLGKKMAVSPVRLAKRVA